MKWIKRRIPLIIILSAILITFHVVTTPVEREIDQMYAQYTWMWTCHKGFGMSTSTIKDHIECLDI